MPQQGFICLDAEVPNIVGTYLPALLHEDAAVDAGSTNGALPSACWWSQLELVWDVTAGAVTEITLKLTWDSAGDNPASEEIVLSTADNTIYAGQTDVSLWLATVDLNVSKRATAGQTTTGKVYLWSKVTAGGGTLTLKKARLQWYVPSYGGR